MTSLAQAFDPMLIVSCRQFHNCHPSRVDSVTSLLDRPLLPGLTVAVCTYLRPESLKAFLMSLSNEVIQPEELVVVDASPGDSSETVLCSMAAERSLSTNILYVRVTGALKGLTRQRNLALRLLSRDVVVFFDDDIVLRPGCVPAMGNALAENRQFVGVGAWVVNDSSEPGWRWRALKLLRAVPDLTPGKYQRSGLVPPLRLAGTLRHDLMVDRLPGCCMAWRSDVARRLRFSDFFAGYSQGEDVEFSRRAAAFGEMKLCAQAQVEHRQDPAGRPNQVQWARMTILNRYFIQKHSLPNRRSVDVVWLLYASLVSTAIVAASFLRNGRLYDACMYLFGSALGVVDLIRPLRSGLSGNLLT